MVLKFFTFPSTSKYFLRPQFKLSYGDQLSFPYSALQFCLKQNMSHIFSTTVSRSLVFILSIHLHITDGSVSSYSVVCAFSCWERPHLSNSTLFYIVYTAEEYAILKALRYVELVPEKKLSSAVILLVVFSPFVFSIALMP